MAQKIRLGFVGANIRSRWAALSHFPALKASPDVELTVVCTTNPASAEEARQALGARLAFSDYREMVKSSEVDAVAVVVRVPSHYGPAKAAIEAGKPVYVEWPLGRTTAEAEELAALAKAKAVPTAVGLQSRVSPPLLYMKELIESGYVGEMLSCKITTLRGSEHGAFFERHTSHIWHSDVTLGANPLTIAAGHVIDALRFVAGEVTRLGAMTSTQVKQWYDLDTRQGVDVTSPDNVLLNGQLAGGAVFSAHVAYVPWAGSGYGMEIYGREGTLAVTGQSSSQLGKALRLQGAQRSQELRDLEIPERLAWVPRDFPKGNPFNVGQMYALFAQAVREGKAPAQLPTFDTAVEMHRIIDVIRQSSDTGSVQTVSVR